MKNKLKLIHIIDILDGICQLNCIHFKIWRRRITHSPKLQKKSSHKSNSPFNNTVNGNKKVIQVNTTIYQQVTYRRNLFSRVASRKRKFGSCTKKIKCEIRSFNISRAFTF